MEKDANTAMYCAKSLQTKVLSPDEFMQHALEGDHDSAVVVCGCVTDLTIWSALSFMNVSFLLISPPCPPWSGAGKERGMSDPDGKVFSQFLQIAGRMRVHACLAENVPAITKHTDFQVLVAGAALDGLKLYISGVYSCQRSAPLYRDRWLGTFVHASIIIQESQVATAQAIAFASAPLSMSLPGPSLQDADAVFKMLSEQDRAELKIQDEAFKCMQRPDMVPKWLNWKIDWKVDEPILQAPRRFSHMNTCQVSWPATEANICSQRSTCARRDFTPWFLPTRWDGAISRLLK